MTTITLCDICNKKIGDTPPSKEEGLPSHIVVGFNCFELCGECTKPLQRFLERKGLTIKNFFDDEDSEEEA